MIPLPPYAALSYVWKGSPYDSSIGQSFGVQGGEDGDPIGIEALRHACTAALLEGTSMLWLDRLCVLQNSREDKAWQIEHMSTIYQQCQVCLILPGGITRLVSVDEETDWIKRAWTLQEAAIPKRPVVLFAWKHGSGRWEGYNGGTRGEVREVVVGESAMASLLEMLKACLYPASLTWVPSTCPDEPDEFSSCILGSYGDAPVATLLWVLQMEDRDAREMAIWQSSLLRASSRPVDMVFSVMGMFGVTLDTKKFHKNDRVRASVALAQEILKRGGRPVWLAMSLDIYPSRYISSFPDLPSTNVTGTVYWKSRRGPINANVPDDIYDIEEMNEPFEDDDQSKGEHVDSVFLPFSWVMDMPPATMDDDGYLHMTLKAAPVAFTGHIFGTRRTNLAGNNDGTYNFSDVPVGVKRIVSMDGKVWDILKNDIPTAIVGGRKYIAFIGSSKDFPRDPVYNPNPVPIGGIILPKTSVLRAVIVEEHTPGRFHRSSSLTLGENIFQSVIEGWGEREISIGGPEPIPTLLHRQPNTPCRVLLSNLSKFCSFLTCGKYIHLRSQGDFKLK